MELQTPSNNGPNANPPLFEDIDSACSTPYVSAPSSPGRGPIAAAGFFYSAPASPMHFAITAASTHSGSSSFEKNVSSSEFEFSGRFGSSGLGGPGSMSSADELFLNGQIRPMKLSSHLERPQVLCPLVDLEEEEEEEEKEEIESRVRGRDLRLRDKSVRRRTRSLSPLRKTPSEWTENEEEEDVVNEEKRDKKENATPSVSGGSGRSSKRWVFLRDFLRSKSEGRSNNKFWSTISFSPTKDKKPQKPKKLAGKPTNGVAQRRVPVSASASASASASPHELHYKANRAQAEELRKKTFLPYRQGLLGCLGFSSKGYGAVSGFARALNPVSSRKTRNEDGEKTFQGKLPQLV